MDVTSCDKCGFADVTSQGSWKGEITWLIWEGPKCNHKCRYQREERERADHRSRPCDHGSKERFEDAMLLVLKTEERALS